jgi:thiamine-phosphate pyrophosphorylase
MNLVIPNPCVALVTDRSLSGGLDGLKEAVEAAVEGGVTMVQLREKDLDTQDLFQFAQKLRLITDGKALLFVNDRVDIAVASHADGVQLGERGMSIDQARMTIGNRRLLIGRSVHDVQGGLRAVHSGADLLYAGTIFPSKSHPGQPANGIELIRALTMQVNVPVFGIGGITKTNSRDVIDAGAQGVAVISEIFAALDPFDAAKGLREAVDNAYAAVKSAPPMG